MFKEQAGVDYAQSMLSIEPSCLHSLSLTTSMALQKSIGYNQCPYQTAQNPGLFMKSEQTLRIVVCNAIHMLHNVMCVCVWGCLLYTSPSPRDATLSRMPSSA